MAVVEEGKAGWLMVMECVPVVRSWVMECKGGVDGLVVCGLHGSSGHKFPWGCIAEPTGGLLLLPLLQEVMLDLN